MGGEVTGRRRASLWSMLAGVLAMLSATLGAAQSASAAVSPWVVNANFKDLQNVVDVGGSATINATVSNSGNGTAASNVLNIDYPAGTLGYAGYSSTSTPQITSCAVSTPSAADPAKDRITCTVPSLSSGEQASLQLELIAITPGRQPITLAVPDLDTTPGSTPVNLSLTVNSVADFSVTGTGTPSTVDPGSDVTYKFTLKNAGPNDGTNPSFYVDFPAGIDATAKPSNCTLVGTPVTDGPSSYKCTFPGTYPVGTEQVLTFTGTVWGAGPTLDVTGRVISADDNNPGNDSSTVTTAVNQTTALQIGKSHTPAGALINKQQLVFTLKPSFAGLAPGSPLVVTDTLPANFSFTLADVSAGAAWTCTKPDVQTVRCTRAAVAGLQRSAVGTIRITATANWIENDPNDNAPVNTAYLNSGTLAEASGSDQVQILRAEADIQALKSARGGPVNGGGVIVGTPFDFDISARNNGTSLGADSPFFGTLVLDDTLTTNINATNIVTNGWTCNLGSATGPALVTGPISLSAGSVIHCERTYTSANPLRRGDVVPPVTVTAVVPTAGPFNNTLEAWPKDRDQYTDPNIDNNTTSFTGTGTTNIDSADVTIFKSVSPAQPLWGSRSDFVLEAQNLGNPNQDSQGVVITDLFTNLANNTALTITRNPTDKSIGFTCDPQVAVSSSSRQLTCRITTLKPCTRGVDCPTINVSAALAGNSTNPQVTTNAENTAFIASATSDPVPGNNFEKITYTILSNPDAFVLKTATPQTVNAGAELKYSISAGVAAANKGPTQATIEDTLPYGMTFLRTSLPASCTTAQVAAPAPDADKLTTKVTCDLGLISSGRRNVDIFVSPSSDLAAQSPVPNTVNLFASPDSTPDNNSATASVTVVNTEPVLTVQKVDTPHISYLTQDIAYTIKVSNLGGAVASNVDIRDLLPPDMLFVSFSKPADVTCQGVPAAGASTTSVMVRCIITSIGTGDAASKFFTMTLKSTKVSTPVNTVEARLDPTSDEPDAQAQTTSIVLSRVDMEVVSKTADPAAVDLGVPFTYTILLRNRVGIDATTGIPLGDADDVQLTDNLPAGMVLDGQPSPASFCSGTAGATSFNCSFGTVANGEELTVSVPVKVTTLGTGPLPQTFTNTATVSTTSFDVDKDNDSKQGSVAISAGSLAGLVFRDFNNNGVQDPGDTGIGGVVMQLSGTGPGGAPVSLSVTTVADGSYLFPAVPTGSFTVTRGAVGDTALADGIAIPGSAGGTALGATQIGSVNLSNQVATGYDFTLVPNTGIAIAKTLLSGPTANPDGSFDAAFRLTVSNPSSEALQDVVVTDQLAGPAPLFGSFAATPTAPGTYGVTAAPSGSCGGLNAAFNGSSDAKAAQGASLAVGASCTIDFAIRVKPTVPLPPEANGGRYVNQASVTGTGGQSGQTITVPSNPVPLSPVLPQLGLTKVLTGYTDADGSGSVTLDDTLNFTITATNTGSVALTDVVVSDPKLTPDSKTCAIVQPGETCILTGTYVITIEDVQAGQLVNTATADSTETNPVTGPITASVTTPVVAVVGGVTLTKTALVSTAKRGEKVPYVILAQKVPFNPARIVDVMPPGFNFVTGSATSNGTKVEPVVEGRNLTFDGLVPDKDGNIKLELVLIATAAVNPGVSVNQAQLVNPKTGQVAATAKARVTILAEAVFDCGDVIGKVFDDQNRNGYQDEGEPGLPAVRVATVHGLLVTTDAEGRFNIPCADIPDADIGSNFILKLDTRTLPTGYHVTTENPRRVRLTRGKVVKLNFGASISRVVKLEINGKVFGPESTALLPKWQAGLDKLVTALEAESSVLEITYRGSDGELARARLRAVKDAISQRWAAIPQHYDLAIDTRIVSGGAP